LEREEREQTIDLRSERERTIDPDATEDEDGDEEDGRKKEVVDPDATEDEAEEGEEDAAAAAVPANENEQGTSRAQHGLIPAEIALLPVPLPRLQTRPLKLAPERPFDAVQIAEQRRLCIARGINPEEPHKLEAIYYARIAGEHSTWVEAKPAERAGSATQTYFEKRYTKIRPSDGTLADKQRWLAEMWALPKFATQEQKGGEKMMKVVDGMHAVVEKSCQMPICHGVVKEVRKGLRVRAPSPPWGVDLPEKAVGKKSCGKAKGKASPRKKAPLMLATPVVLQPVTLAAAGLCRKRSAATAAVKTVSPSPSKKPRLVIDPPCPEADPKHSGHADYMAHLDAKKEAKASVSPPVDAPIRGKRQTRKTVKVEAMEVEGASGGWDGSWSFH